MNLPPIADNLSYFSYPRITFLFLKCINLTIAYWHKCNLCQSVKWSGAWVESSGGTSSAPFFGDITNVECNVFASEPNCLTFATKCFLPIYIGKLGSVLLLGNVSSSLLRVLLLIDFYFHTHTGD